MEEYFRFRYYMEIYGIVFAILVLSVIGIIYIVDSIKEKIKEKKRKRR